MTLRPLHSLCARLRAQAPLLLYLSSLAAHGAIAKPAKKPAAHFAGSKTATRGRQAAKPAHARASSAGRSPVRSSSARGRSNRTASSRLQARHLVRVDPVSRLDTISSIATTLSRGGSAISYPAALNRYYAALATHGDDPSADTVRALQFGDSHTAADMFTGEARRVLQRQFGNGSVGFTYAGHPFAGYRILGSQRTQSGGWQTLGTHFGDLGDAMLGMGGVGVSTARAGEYITLDAPCTTLQVDYLQQPGGGKVRVTDNGAPVDEIATATNGGTDYTPGHFAYTCPETNTATQAQVDHHFVLTTETDAPVRLFGVTALEPGVTWESIGINGAEAPLILRWDQRLFTSYLRETAASLVVLAYGTNEAAAAHWDRASYSAVFTQLIESIHRTLPGASVLVLGPTDRAAAARRRGFAPFPGTERILEAQREVCRSHGCAFWDQQRRMGGFGSMSRWVYAGWAQHDHTHLTGEGYRALADALMADLLSGYDAYRNAHGLPALSSLPSRRPDIGSTESKTMKTRDY